MDIARQVIQTYINDNPNLMVKHHIDSYTDFIVNQIPSFIKEENPSSLILEDNRKINIYIGGKDAKIKFTPPEEEGVSILPHVCRLENKTYALDVTADIVVEYDYGTEKETKVFSDVFLGKIPLLLRSPLCYLSSLSGDKLYDVGECKFELGGYFIITGQERVLLSQESLGTNMFYAQKRIQPPSAEAVRTRTEKELKVMMEKSEKENDFQFICGITSESEDGTMRGRHLLIIPPLNKVVNDPQKISKETDYSNFSTNRLATIFLPGFDNDVPVFSVFHALGFTTDEEIYNVVLAGVHEKTIYDSLFAELLMSHEKFVSQQIKLQEDQSEDIDLLLLRKQTRTQGKGAVFINLFSKLFSHCEKQDESVPTFFRRKAYLLGHMFKMAMDVCLGKQNTDRDSFIFKRVNTSGELCFNEFRKIYRETVSMMTIQLDRRVEFEKQNYRGKDLSKLIQEENLRSYYWKSGNFLDKFEKSFKGSWDGQYGVSQVLSRISYLGAISHLRRVNLTMDKQTKQTAPRKLHSSSWGFMCPVDNPDGKNIGMIKSLALFSGISVHTKINDIKNIIFASKNIKQITFIHPSVWDVRWTKLFLNSDLVCVIMKDTEAFHTSLVEKRRSGEINKTISLFWNRLDNEYFIQTDAGRPIRYLYREGVRPETIKNLKTWESMTRYMDIVDSRESECLKISMEAFNSELPSEIHGSVILSPSSGINPYIDHNQAPRNMFACQQVKQACSWANTAFNKRFDAVGVHLHSPQRPICQTWMTEQILAGGCISYGENPIVAIGMFDGYNQEDSIIINNSALKRGLFFLTSYHAYDEQEKVVDYATQNHTMIVNLTTDPKFRETVQRNPGKDYSFLDSDGVVKVGTKVFSDTILIGMVSPITHDGNIVKYMDISVLPKKGEFGFVDAVYHYTTDEGFQGIKIRIAEGRHPIVGDKFGSRHGQKGTCGTLVPEEDMPVTSTGLRPDMIVNPHALPSRMTIGQFLETMGSKIGAELGTFVDGTPFSKSKQLFDMRDILIKLGYHPYGNEIMYNGMNGEQLESEIFVGPTFYQRFKHMVEDKINYRSTGPRTLLTHQPLEGRANDGGLRIGEMERDSLIAHGLSNFLEESMMKRSDEHEFLYQKETGLLDYNSDYPVSKVRIPYSAGLLVKELESMHLQVKLFS